jgi:hypothetical protein
VVSSCWLWCRERYGFGARLLVHLKVMRVVLMDISQRWSLIEKESDNVVA